MKHSRATKPAQPAWSVFPELEPSGAGPRIGAGRSVANPSLQLVDGGDQAAQIGNLRATVLSFSNFHRHGELFASYMRARKAVFIDRLNWQLASEDGMEFDQYDTPFARWIVIHEFGEVMAGVRLLPTTARVGLYTYMLRDAQRGVLENIPSDVLFFEAPVEDRIWEATRLFISDSVPGQRRLAVQNTLMKNFARAARAGGASHVIGIVPALWSRWLRRLDLGAVPVGPRFSIDGTASQAALFNVTERGASRMDRSLNL